MKTMKGKLGKDSMTSSLNNINLLFGATCSKLVASLAKSDNPSLATIAGSDFGFFASKTVKRFISRKIC